jgi:hypothetical protein
MAPTLFIEFDFESPSAPARFRAHDANAREHRWPPDVATRIKRLRGNSTHPRFLLFV